MHLICDLRSTKKGCGGKLWLGGEAASGDLALLEAHQITTVMPASKNPRPVESFGVKVYKYVDGTGLANGDYSLEDFFEVADQLVRRLLQGHAILVCCKNGAHRSATLVVIIVMRLFSWGAFQAANYVSGLRNIVDLESLPPPRAGRLNNVKPIDFLLSNEDRIIKNAFQYVGNVTLTPIQFRKKALELGFHQLASRPKSKAMPRAPRSSGYSSFEMLTEPEDTMASAAEHSTLSSTDSSAASLKRQRLSSGGAGGFVVLNDDLSSTEKRVAKLHQLCNDLQALDDKLLQTVRPAAQEGKAAKATGQVDPGQSGPLAASGSGPAAGSAQEVKKEDEVKEESKDKPMATGKTEDTSDNTGRAAVKLFFWGWVMVFTGNPDQ